jgi:hypothetical protein
MLSTISRIFRLIGQAMKWMVSLPFELWYQSFVRMQDTQDAAVHQAAQQAEVQALLQESQADARSDTRELLRALKKVAAIRATGIRPDPSLIGRLPKCHFDYVLALTIEECARVAKFPLASIRALLADEGSVGGVRSLKNLQTCSREFVEVSAGTTPASKTHTIDMKRRLELFRTRKSVSEDKADEVLISMGLRRLQ